MTHQQILHEVGVMILGGTGMYFLQGWPMDEQIKRIATIAIGIVTVAFMARIAGVV